MTALSEAQQARLEAVEASAAVLKKRTAPKGPLASGGSEPADVGDICDLAEYILLGTHPMARYADVREVALTVPISTP